MKVLHAIQRPIVVVMLAAFMLATFAPLAEADRRKRRYKGGRGYTRVVERHHAPVHRYYRRGDSNAGPLVAGLIGGFILGALTTKAARQEKYVYWDPYCERGYSSFDDCRAHWGCHDGPKVLYQVDSRSGRCVDAWRHSSDGWHRWDGNPAGWGEEYEHEYEYSRTVKRKYGTSGGHGGYHGGGYGHSSCGRECCDD